MLVVDASVASALHHELWRGGVRRDVAKRAHERLERAPAEL